jgi:hypothetical protein
VPTPPSVAPASDTGSPTAGPSTRPVATASSVPGSRAGKSSVHAPNRTSGAHAPNCASCARNSLAEWGSMPPATPAANPTQTHSVNSRRAQADRMLEARDTRAFTNLKGSDPFSFRQPKGV